MPEALSRRSRKRERTRGAILAAAERLLSVHELRELRLEVICEEADVARATFFLHFDSKLALRDAWESDLVADIERRLPDAGPRAAARYRAMAEVLWARPGAARCAVFGALAEPRAGPLVGCVGRELHALQRRGELRAKVSPELAARSWLAVAAALLATHEGREGRAALLEELIALTLPGIVERKPRLKWTPGASRTL